MKKQAKFDEVIEGLLKGNKNSARSEEIVLAANNATTMKQSDKSNYMDLSPIRRCTMLVDAYVEYLACSGERKQKDPVWGAKNILDCYMCHDANNSFETLTWKKAMKEYKGNPLEKLNSKKSYFDMQINRVMNGETLEQYFIVDAMYEAGGMSSGNINSEFTKMFPLQRCDLLLETFVQSFEKKGTKGTPDAESAAIDEVKYFLSLSEKGKYRMDYAAWKITLEKYEKQNHEKQKNYSKE